MTAPTRPTTATIPNGPGTSPGVSPFAVRALVQAARQVTALHPATDLFSPGLSLLVLLAWPAAAAILIARRDA